MDRLKSTGQNCKHDTKIVNLFNLFLSVHFKSKRKKCTKKTACKLRPLPWWYRYGQRRHQKFLPVPLQAVRALAQDTNWLSGIAEQSPQLKQTDT